MVCLIQRVIQMQFVIIVLISLVGLSDGWGMGLGQLTYLINSEKCQYYYGVMIQLNQDDVDINQIACHATMRGKVGSIPLFPLNVQCHDEQCPFVYMLSQLKSYEKSITIDQFSITCNDNHTAYWSTQDPTLLTDGICPNCENVDDLDLAPVHMRDPDLAPVHMRDPDLAPVHMRDQDLAPVEDDACSDSGSHGDEMNVSRLVASSRSFWNDGLLAFVIVLGSFLGLIIVVLGGIAIHLSYHPRGNCTKTTLEMGVEKGVKIGIKWI
jgi:hypothetical protein